MNQVEQWFSILQRKRLRILDFSDLDRLAERLMTFVAEWNLHAHYPPASLRQNAGCIPAVHQAGDHAHNRGAGSQHPQKWPHNAAATDVG